MTKNIITTTGVITLLAAAFLLNGCSSGQAENVYPYPFESAKIEFEIKGSVEGKTTVVLKGDKSVHETIATNKIGEKPEEIHTVFLDLGETVYQINKKDNTGGKFENTIYTDLKELNKEERIEFLTKAALGMSQETEEELKVDGEKEIAGTKCDLYKNETYGEICIWYGIPLYSKTVIEDVGIDTTTTVTSIQLNVDVPDSYFEIPSEIKISEEE